MLEVEYRVVLLALLVAWRGVNECAAYAVGALGVEENLLYIAVRDILERIEIAVCRRNLDAAFPAGGAVEVECPRVVEDASVNREVIVVESLVHRSCGGACPESVFALCQHGAALASQAEADHHGLRLRSLDPEACVALGVDHRVFLSGLVEF